MTDDTSGTRPDPEQVAEGDTDQLPREDTLTERGVDDLLDEGWSPPDHPHRHLWGETAWEESRGETLDQRVAQEEPEVWDTADGPDAGAAQPDRAGRLVADDAAVEAGGTDAFARDAGVAGGAASAEEAAMHVVEEDLGTGVDAEPLAEPVDTPALETPDRSVTDTDVTARQDQEGAAVEGTAAEGAAGQG